MYRIISTKPMDLLPQQPEIQCFVVDSRDRDSRVSLLLVETIELLKEIDFGTRRGLYRVQALQSCLEAECLKSNNTLMTAAR